MLSSLNTLAGSSILFPKKSTINAPTNLTIYDITETTISIQYDYVADADNYIITTSPTTTTFNTTSNIFTLTGLTSGVLYTVYVRSQNTLRNVISSPVSVSDTTGVKTVVNVNASASLVAGTNTVFVFNGTSGFYNFGNIISSNGISMRVLAVAGGGGGGAGYDGGGGGGGGGVVDVSFLIQGNYWLEINSGAGGIGGDYGIVDTRGTEGSRGGNTTIGFGGGVLGNVVALGGGGGGKYSLAGSTGGSGGGAGYGNIVVATGNTTLNNRASSGGKYVSGGGSAGGGGAGASGADASGGLGGSGGAGYQSSITGSALYWGGGGGGVSIAGNGVADSASLFGPYFRDYSLLFNRGNKSGAREGTSYNDLSFATLEGWIRNSGTVNSLQILFGVWPRYMLLLNNNNVLAAYDYGANTFRQSSITVSDGNWHHVALVFDLSNDSSSTLYYDGSAVLSNFTLKPSATVAPTLFYISGLSIDTGVGFTGFIDDIRIWNYKRTGAEIWADYNKRISPTTSGLVGYWLFNEGSGTNVMNEVSGGPSLTLVTGTSTLPTWSAGRTDNATIYSCSVYAPSVNEIYMFPASTTTGNILVFDISSSTYTSITNALAYKSAVYAPNGKIYALQSTTASTTSIVIVDTLSGDAITTISGISNGSSANAWENGILAPNGNIYFVPRVSTSVLIVNTALDTASTTTITGLGGGSNWMGGVLGQNGKIYCAPLDSSYVMVINTTNNTANQTAISVGTGTDKWNYGVAGPNGEVYFFPRTTGRILAINTYNDTVDSSFAFTNYGANSGVLAPNGKIYAAPHTGTVVYAIDPMNNSVSTFGTIAAGADKYYATVAADNGILYGVPYSANQFLRMTPALPTVAGGAAGGLGGGGGGAVVNYLGSSVAGGSGGGSAYSVASAGGNSAVVPIVGGGHGAAGTGGGGGGGTFKDAVATVNRSIFTPNGTVMGTATFTNDCPMYSAASLASLPLANYTQKSMYFNGSTYVALGSSSNYAFDTGTYECLFKAPVNGSGVRALMAKSGVYGLYLDASNRLVAGYYGFGTRNLTEVFTDASFVNDNAWHHAAITFTKNFSLSLYLDGILKRTGNAANYSLLLNGSSQYLDAGATTYRYTSQGTVELWIRNVGSNTSYRQLIGVVGLYSLYLLNNVLIVYDWVDNVDKSSSQTINDGQWHHVALSFRFDVIGGSTFYYDGVPVGSRFTYKYNTNTSIYRNFWIGLGTNVITQLFSGYVDDARVWNVARSDAEILANYNKFISPTTPGLDGYWLMNENTGTTVTNQVSGGPSLTLVGSPTWSPGRASVSLVQTTAPIQLGADNSANLFTGSIANARVWNTVRSASDISANQFRLLRNCDISTDGLHGSYPLNDVSSAIANHAPRIGGYGGSGAVAVAVPTVNIFKKNNYGLVFRGSTGAIECATSAAEFALSTGTIDCWIKTANAGSGLRALVVKPNAYGLYLNNGIAGAYDFSTSTFITTGVNVANNAWHHIRLVFNDSVANGSTLYVNRVLRATFTSTFTSNLIRFTPQSTVLSGISNQITGIAINASKNRLVLCFYGGNILYSTWNGSSWSTPVSTLNTTNRNWIGIAMSGDGSRIAMIVDPGLCYYSTWNGSNYTNPTQTLETTQRNYPGLDMTNDGSRIVVPGSGKIYFATWNGSNYTAFTQTLDTTITAGPGIGITNDGSRIAYFNNSNPATLYYADWNGTNYTSAITSRTLPSGNSRNVKFSLDNTYLFISTQGANAPIYYVQIVNSLFSTVQSVPTTILPTTSDGWPLAVSRDGTTIYRGDYSSTIIYSTNVSQSGILGLRNNPANTTQGYLGQIYNVRIWNYMRTDFTATSSLSLSPEMGLIGSWPLNEGVNSAVYNYAAVLSANPATMPATSDFSWNAISPADYAPTQLGVVDITETTATLNFQMNGYAVSYDITTVPTTSTWNITNNTFQFTGLTAGTNYTVNVYGIDKYGQRSTVAASTFKTFSNTTYYYKFDVGDFSNNLGFINYKSGTSGAAVYDASFIPIASLTNVLRVSPILGINANNFTATSYVSPYQFQNGVYDISASSSGLGSGNVYLAFDNSNATWWSTDYYGSTSYSTGYTQNPYDSSGLYIGGGTGRFYTTTTQNVGTLSGEYIQVKTPYQSNLTSFRFQRTTPYTLPRSYRMLGSNDGTVWRQIHSQTDTIPDAQLSATSFGPTTNIPLSGVTGTPSAIAASADNMRLFIVIYGQSYRSGLFNRATNTWNIITTSSSILWNCCTMTYDGRRAIGGAFPGLIYHYTWDDATSTYTGQTSAADTTSRNYTDIAVSADGSRLIIGVENSRIYFATWDNANSRYGTFNLTLDTNALSGGWLNRPGVGMSLDGNIIAYGTTSPTTRIATWNGTNYSVPVATTNSYGGTRYRFLPDNKTIIMMIQSNFDVCTTAYFTWDGTSLSASSTSITTLPTDSKTMHISGDGRIIYTCGATTKSIPINYLNTIPPAITVSTNEYYNTYRLVITETHPYQIPYIASLDMSAIMSYNPISSNVYQVGTGSLDMINNPYYYLSLPPFTTTLAGFSAAFWVRGGIDASNAPVFDFGQPDASNVLSVRFSSGVPQLFMNQLATTYSYNMGSTSLLDNSWNHIAWSIAPSTGVWTAYLNNVPLTTGVSAYPTTVSRTANYIGTPQTFASGYDSIATSVATTTNGFASVYSPETNKIYMFPALSNGTASADISILDVNTNAISSVSVGTSRRYASVNRAANTGKFYARSDSTMLIFNPIDNSYSTLTLNNSSSVAWENGAYSDYNQTMVYIPRRATDVLVINTITNDISYVSTGLSANSDAFFGGVYSPATKKVYGVPLTSATVCTFDTSTNVFTLSAITHGLGANQYAWANGVLAANGNIYCFNSAATNMLVINPISNTTSQPAGLNISRFSSGVVSPYNNKIYCSPSNINENKLYIIDTTTNTINTTDVSFVSSSSYSNVHTTVIASNYNIYSIPSSAGTIMRLKMNYTLTTSPIYLDDFRAFNSALDSTQVANLYYGKTFVQGLQPSNLTILAITVNPSITLSFTASPLATRYEVLTSPPTQKWTTTNTTLTLTGLANSTTYTLYVYGLNDFGDRSPPATLTVSMFDMPKYYYKFDATDFSGTKIANYIPNATFDTSYSSTDLITSPITTVNPAVGTGALYLNRTTKSNLILPSFTNSASGMSLSVWFKSAADASNSVIFDASSATTVLSVRLYSGRPTFFLQESGTEFSAAIERPVVDGSWNHLLWNIDSSGYWSAYVNGLEYNMSIRSVSITPIDATSATVSYTALAGATSYQIRTVPQTSVWTTPNLSQVISGLSPTTTYRVLVSALLGTTKKSQPAENLRLGET